MKRLFDFFFAFFFLILLLPLFLFIALFIIMDSPGGVFYTQKRVGYRGRDFNLLKFRTMRTGADKSGLLTVGSKDSRITRIGYFLRKYKMDELPQLINIILGHMSVVGPRPEVRRFVNMYNEEQLKILNIRPGLTDMASLQYINESDLLAGSPDPEKLYVNDIMPTKLKHNLKYIQERSFFYDIKIIFLTVRRIFGG